MNDLLKRAPGLVTTALENAVTDERDRWRPGPHSVARNEYRLHNDEPSFRIDRLIEGAQRTKWVADYNLSEYAGGDIEAFHDEQRERYAVQLDAYADAVGSASAGLYFPLHEGWRDW